MTNLKTSNGGFNSERYAIKDYTFEFYNEREEIRYTVSYRRTKGLVGQDRPSLRKKQDT